VQRGVVEVMAEEGAVRLVDAEQQVRADAVAVNAEAAESEHFAMLDELFPRPSPPAEEELPPPPIPTVRVKREPESLLVARVVRRRLNTVRECYQHELKNVEGLAGDIDVEIVIGERGQVRRARVVSDTVGSEVVASCITDRVKRWRFHQPRTGELHVTIPFVFTLGGGAQLGSSEP
jgi:TonB family protein